MQQHIYLLTAGNTPSQKYSTLSQKCPIGVIIAIAVAIIVILLVIITILSVIITILSILLKLKRKKQPPTVQRDQVNMSKIYDEVDDIVKTNEDYQELDISRMDDVICSEDYEDLDTEKMDKATQYASLK